MISAADETNDVNDPNNNRHIIKKKPPIPLGGSAEYRIRSAMLDSKTQWSEPPVILCDNRY
jgi:hypothetical protein